MRVATSSPRVSLFFVLGAAATAGALAVGAAGCMEPAKESRERTVTAKAVPAGSPTQVAARTGPREAKSFRFTAAEEMRQVAPAEMPVSLTASDGTGLALVSLRADAVVDDP